MTRDHWRRIEKIFGPANELALDRRAAFLDRACGGDTELRRELDSLLAQSSADGLLDQPAIAVAEGLLNETVTQSTPTAQFGPYQVKSQLGAGGMGTVYLAEDTRLGRNVAIKVSRGAFTERFTREARAISALNHPHICTLHDVGPDYLVMELVEGETLASRLKQGPLAMNDVLLYGSQIADALAEAHSRGIVHRDLKPANIMITRHGVKVLDFGLAKILSETGITETNVVMGTPAYMSPEQLQGRMPTNTTDLFALGLVLYEMTAGRLPFPAASLGRMLISGSEDKAPALSQDRADTPHTLDRLVAKLLEKDPAARCQSAALVADELSALSHRLSAPSPPATRSAPRPLFLISAVVTILLLAGTGFRLYQRSEQRHWAREQAIPEIARLSPQTPLAAFQVLNKAQVALPGDPQLAAIAGSLTRRVSIQSSPPGAVVEIQDYRAPDGRWLALGATPLSGVPIPRGYFRWRVSRPGTGQLLVAPVTQDRMEFTLAPLETSARMVHVPKGGFVNYISFVGWMHYSLPPYDIDKFEVTNRQYQEFVDNGGYRKREYWKQEFSKDGRQIDWDQAMEVFRDPTGRPGPSTWQGGHYPQGHADDPVSGVSWYEAAAYAEFAGKSLPTIGQWFQAAPPDLARYNIDPSNFGGRGPWSVGSAPNVGPFGTYDMAGNVREWCLNVLDKDQRFIAGGGWRDQPYAAYDPDAIAPFDRSDLNGFRCVRNKAPLPADVTAPLVRIARDFSQFKPVSDDVFRAYQTMYAYDRTPLKAQSEGDAANAPDWTRESIDIDAGNGTDRLPLYLFLPKNVRPPFQTVVFFPSARVNTMPSSQNPGDLQFVDYVIQSGRALIYPIYTGTYGRRANGTSGAIGSLNVLIRRSKEVRRSVDYLETRPEIDKSKIAYLGVSQGSAYGPVFTALEPRFKTIVFLDGGFFLDKDLPAGDQANFVPRIMKPVLMVNGRYDFAFPLDRAQEPMFRMLGTPAADKHHVLFDTGHDVSQRKADLSKEVLAWLDKYLGRVN